MHVLQLYTGSKRKALLSLSFVQFDDRKCKRQMETQKTSLRLALECDQPVVQLCLPNSCVHESVTTPIPGTLKQEQTFTHTQYHRHVHALMCSGNLEVLVVKDITTLSITV